MTEKTWDEILYNLRDNLSKTHPVGLKNPKLIGVRRRLRKCFRLGIVYFIQRPDGLIKIGFTANLPKRFKELKRLENKDIILLGAVRASMRYEKRLHKMFGFCHSHKEWFNPSALLLLYINTFSDV